MIIVRGIDEKGGMRDGTEEEKRYVCTRLDCFNLLYKLYPLFPALRRLGARIPFIGRQVKRWLALLLTKTENVDSYPGPACRRQVRLPPRCSRQTTTGIRQDKYSCW